MKTHHIRLRLFALGMVFAVGVLSFNMLAAAEVSANSTAQNTPVPSRIVSLSPSVTEAIITLGAEDLLVGVTYHCTLPPEVAHKPVVGGYFNPSVEAVLTLNPDLIIVTSMHNRIREQLAASGARIVQMDDTSIADFYDRMNILGAMLHKESQAKDIIARVTSELAHIKELTDRIPQNKRIRALRILGRDTVMVPGDDTFHNEYIRAAGGIPATFGQESGLQTITVDQWKKFNPQLVFYCGNDKVVIDKYFHTPGWKDVDAVKNNRIVGFPCDLTCRISTHAGYFVQWLSSSMYSSEFVKNKPVHPDALVGKTPVKVDIPWVSSATKLDMHLYDFKNTAMVVNFSKPMEILSTLEGPRSGITTIGNHYTPPPCWGMLHCNTMDALKKRFCKVIDANPETTSLLYTGANTHNTSVQKRQFKDMAVYALVTAGVTSNAMRSGKDSGAYYEPGTINIMLLTNMKLSPRAMTRAIITATEAKSAAMQDLDIRSSAQPQYQATGTGTDNIIVVQGDGTPIDCTGGHTKMGELIAQAVHAGVIEAVYRQNGMVSSLNIFQKLKSRRIEIFRLGRYLVQHGIENGYQLSGKLETLLLQKKYASFLEAAFAISDDYEAGLVFDLTLFDAWCKTIASDIAGKPIDRNMLTEAPKELPPVLRRALLSLLSGLYHQTTP